MRIGALRHRITFLAHSGTADGQGGYVDDVSGNAGGWTEVCTVWGECIPLSGRELYYAQQIIPTVSHRLTVRYRKDIDSTMRARIGETLLEIHAVMDVETRHEQLKILCEEVHPR